MAAFKYGKFFSQTDHHDFDTEHQPGAAAPHAGIYRCTSCGNEFAVKSGEPLPDEEHQHSLTNGAIRWQLIAFAVTK